MMQDSGWFIDIDRLDYFIITGVKLALVGFSNRL